MASHRSIMTKLTPPANYNTEEKLKYFYINHIRSVTLNELNIDYEPMNYDKNVMYYLNTAYHLMVSSFSEIKEKIDEFIEKVKQDDDGCLFVDGENLIHNFQHNEDLSRLGKALKNSKQTITNGSNKNFHYCIFFLQKNKMYREEDIITQLNLAGFTHTLVIFTENETEIDDILLIYAFIKNLKNDMFSTIISSDKFRWFPHNKKIITTTTNHISRRLTEGDNFYAKGLKLEKNEILEDDISYVTRNDRRNLKRKSSALGNKLKKQITRTKPKPKKQRTRTKPKPKKQRTRVKPKK